MNAIVGESRNYRLLVNLEKGVFPLPGGGILEKFISLFLIIGYLVPYRSNWFGPNLVPIKKSVPYNWHPTVYLR